MSLEQDIRDLQASQALIWARINQISNPSGQLIVTPETLVGSIRTKGSATITSGNTSVVVTHGAGITPGVNDIYLTANEDPTNTPGILWVDTIGATQFTVHCENDPGASNLTFGWTVLLL